MPSDKARLYVALYARGGEPKMPSKEDRYHWALLVGPKNESKDLTGTRHHVKNAPGQSTWVYEERTTAMTATNMILVRIMIGKINDPEAFMARLRQVAVKNDDPAFNCVEWLQSALASIAQDKSIMGASVLGWDTVKNQAMQYCEQKRVEGRFSGGTKADTSKVPTFDLLSGKEVVK